MEGEMEIIKPGLFTSLQDLGRKGYRHLAIPNGGALDRASARRVNLMLNNNANAPILECTQMGPVLKFNAPCQVAMAGATVEVKLNDAPINKSILEIEAGDVLNLQKITQGKLLYLGIKNGFIAESFFCACSAVAGLSTSMRFEKNDKQAYYLSNNRGTLNANLKSKPFNNDKVIECLAGPDFSLLSEMQIARLTETTFQILPTANRMAYPLKGSTKYLENQFNILTNPVIPGTIQLTPSGQLIVLMRDAQTTGGYPRILTLPEKSINKFAQLKTNQEFLLHLTARS